MEWPIEFLSVLWMANYLDEWYGQYDLSAVRSFGWTNLSLTKFSQFSDSGTVEWRIGKGFGDWYERKGLVRKAI